MHPVITEKIRAVLSGEETCGNINDPDTLTSCNLVEFKVLHFMPVADIVDASSQPFEDVVALFPGKSGTNVGKEF